MSADIGEIPTRVHRERKPPPSADQRKEQLDALCRALDTICEAWPDALAAAQARGYPRQSPGPKAAAGEVRTDPEYPLHTRDMPPAKASGSAFGDQTGNSAIQADPSSRWIRDASRCLALLIRMAPSDFGGVGDGTTFVSRWTGPFWPPYMNASLRRAAADVVELWPANCALLFERIHNLANVARAEWPPTPKPGAVVETDEGTVVVGGGRAETGASCTKCGRYVAGTAADPIRRIDGAPYDVRCWEAARKRKQRAS